MDALTEEGHDSRGAVAEAPPESTAVRVALRVRPLVAREQQEKSCLRVDAPSVVLGKERAFHFDFAFDETCTQQQLYDTACGPLVEHCFQGYNATVFAYGQTGSGKTYTVSGSLSQLLQAQA